MTTPSPNFGERRGGARPDLIVIHYTAMATCAEARARLCDPLAEVSAHWLISETGEAEMLVAEEMRAWHAGAGEWAGVTDVNSRSVGIELANPGNAPFPGPQMRALEELLCAIMDRWHIPPHRVIGHSDMAPERKRDPGPRFDWRGLARAGLSVWPNAGAGAQPVPSRPPLPPQEGTGERGLPGTELSGQVASLPARFDAAARSFGYAGRPEAVLAAFRLRFRPWATGPVDAADAGMAADLALRFPVDATGPTA